MVRNVLIGAAVVAVPVAAVAGYAMKRGRHRSSDDRPITADMEGPRDAYGVSVPV